jgi:hypothetical protein
MGGTEAIDFSEVVKYLQFAWEAHWYHTKPGHERFRRHDGATPFFVHSQWASATIMHEPLLPLELRWLGWRALVLHDVREDTDLPIPEWVPQEVVSLVEEMTFATTQEGMERIWERSPEAQLFTCYDKASVLQDATWMEQRPPEYRRAYEDYALQLATLARERYGDLNVYRIIRAVCQTV